MSKRIEFEVSDPEILEETIVHNFLTAVEDVLKVGEARLAEVWDLPTARSVTAACEHFREVYAAELFVQRAKERVRQSNVLFVELGTDNQETER